MEVEDKESRGERWGYCDKVQDYDQTRK